MSEQAMVPTAAPTAVLTAPVTVISAVAAPAPELTVAGVIAGHEPGGDADDDDIASRIAVVVGRLHRRIRPNHDGLSHGLISALGTIVRYGDVRPGDLARVESVAAPTMTRIIADLEGRGLIIRQPDPSDGRSFFVTATDAGTAAIRRAKFERAERVARLLETLPSEQIALLEGAIDALEAAAESGTTPATLHRLPRV